MDKYVTVTVHKVIISIAKPTDIEGYTVGVLESFLPDDEELKKMSEKEIKKWVKENNSRMKAICKFLNEREKDV